MRPSSRTSTGHRYRIKALVLNLVAALLPVPVVHGEPASSRHDCGAHRRGKAELHFRRGVEFHQDGDFNSAFGEFEQSQQLCPLPEILYNLGLTQRQLFRYAEAIETLERYLRDARVNPKRRREVEQLIHEMRAPLIPIDLEIGPAGAMVQVDGRSLGPGAKRRLGLTAGRHVVEVSAPNCDPVRHEIALLVGSPLSLRLVATRRVGRVRVVAAPALATLRVDDQLIGVGAAEVELPTGGHLLEVAAPGYQTQRSELAVATGQRRELRVVLERPPTARARSRAWVWALLGAAAAGGAAAAIAVPLASGPQAPIPGTLQPGAQRVD